MCATGKVGDALFRPHRLFGGPSLLDPMLHPYDKYNAPKVESAPNPQSRAAPMPAAAPAETNTAATRKRAMGNMGVLTYGAITSQKPSTTVRVGGS